MNIYSIDMIKKDLIMNTLIYKTKSNTHSETLELPYTESTNLSDIKYISLTENIPIHTNWMNILDLNTQNKISSLEIFINLKSSLTYLNIGDDYSITEFSKFIKNLDFELFNNIVSNIMYILKDTFNVQPIMGYLYPLYYKILHSLYLYINNTTDTKATIDSINPSIDVLRKEINNLETSFKNAINYVNAIFIQPATFDIHILPSKVAEIYHSYCLSTNKENYYVDTLDSLKINTFSFFEDTKKNKSWKNYLTEISTKVVNNDYNTYPITTFEQFIHIGINLMIADTFVIKKCKLCKNYFKVKYFSKQIYCTRIYKETATTCSEYASRKSYKERLFSNPIHSEFTKAYNRLYARIRRGTLPADTPLMDELKSLHDDYTEKYENTHQKDRELIWKEYIQKNNELLKQ